jgi:iron complex transport system ATP-binding protein
MPRRSSRALASTGTAHLADRLFATLSGGEKQRVVIAAALAQLVGLTPEGGSHVRFLFSTSRPRRSIWHISSRSRRCCKALHDERRAAIVISTHDISLAARSATRSC